VCGESRPHGSEGAPTQQCVGATRLITGEGNRSAIGTLVERSTRYVMLLHLPTDHTAEAVRDAPDQDSVDVAGASAPFVDLGIR